MSSVPSAEVLVEIARANELLAHRHAVLAMEDGRTFEFDQDHQPAGHVPKGGSCCANCIYLGTGDDGVPVCRCHEFVEAALLDKPAGSDVLPCPPDEYCSDWWKTSTPQLTPQPTLPPPPSLDSTFTP